MRVVTNHAIQAFRAERGKLLGVEVVDRETGEPSHLVRRRRVHLHRPEPQHGMAARRDPARQVRLRHDQPQPGDEHARRLCRGRLSLGQHQAGRRGRGRRRHCRADDSGVPAGTLRPVKHRVIFGDNLPALRELPDGSVDLIYIDPPFNTGKVQRHTQLKTVQSDDGDRSGFAGRRYRTSKVGTRAYADAVRRLPGLSRAAAGRGAAGCSAPSGIALLPHRLSRGPLLQGAARRHLRPRLLPQRDHLGLRLRRAHHAQVAAQARQHPGLRQGPRALPLQHRRGRAHPLHGARPGGAGEGGARQAAHRHVVAHHRADQRPGDAPATRRRSPWASSSASWPHRPRPAGWCSTSLRAAVRPARPAFCWGAASS